MVHVDSKERRQLSQPYTYMRKHTHTKGHIHTMIHANICMHTHTHTQEHESTYTHIHRDTYGMDHKKVSVFYKTTTVQRKF